MNARSGMGDARANSSLLQPIERQTPAASQKSYPQSFLSSRDTGTTPNLPEDPFEKALDMVLKWAIRGIAIVGGAALLVELIAQIVMRTR